MTNHPNRSQSELTGTRSFIIGECTARHDRAHKAASESGNHATQDNLLDIAAEWSAAAEWAANLRHGRARVRRIRAGRTTFTLTITD